MKVKAETKIKGEQEKQVKQQKQYAQMYCNITILKYIYFKYTYWQIFKVVGFHSQYMNFF